MRRHEVIKKLKETEPALRGVGVAALYLFGSYAHDEAKSDSDVDVFVEDASGKRITADEGYSDMGIVRWEPTKTQEYTIRVKNLGNEDNVVQMGHN